MLRMILPFCLMLMAAPPTHAFDLLGLQPADIQFPPDYPPNPKCHYSFYIGRNWIQIRDNYGTLRDCRYAGSTDNFTYIYDCIDDKKESNGEHVEVIHNGWGSVRWVRLNSTEDLTAYCR